MIERESDWKSMETVCIDLVNEYLSFGKYAGKLKEYQAIGIGFVDGDLHILYERFANFVRNTRCRYLLF